MNINLSGKNALVGGSSRGIGQAVAIELSKAGANVTLMGRDADRLAGTLKELHRAPGQDHDFLVVDHSDLTDLKKKVRPLVMNKTVHILINNSGGPPGGPITEARPGDFTAAFQQHLVCSHLLVKAVLPGMKRDHYGRIINIISTSVKEPIDDLGVSNTIRAAVANWAKTLANETGQFGITVNNVLPGYTLTDRATEVADLTAKRLGITREEVVERWNRSTPLGRMASPNEIANAVLFLATPAASYITGINLPVDGGRTRSL